MKKASFFLLLMASLVFFSCKKEKMQSKKLLGNWNITEFLANNDSLSLDLLNVEETASVLEYKFSEDSFKLEYTLEYSGSAPFTFPFSGTWNIANDKIRLKYDTESISSYLTGDGTKVETWDIYKISKTKLELAGKNGGLNCNINGDKE